MFKPTSCSLVLLLAVVGAGATGPSPAAQQVVVPVPAAPLFQPSTYCMVCHNGLTTTAGEDISFGTAWRASMMAQSARDPYWHAGVRREVTDHPSAKAAIENECSRCHMPMAHVMTQAAGAQQTVFDNIPIAGKPPGVMPSDGVSCALCHQISDTRLGDKSSFGGGFVVDTVAPPERRRIYGRFDVDRGRRTLMRSATGFEPGTGPHIERSEVCATCHTLYTHTLDATGHATGEFPEQMPYQEWLHSAYRDTQSCQACHMPAVTQATAFTSVAGEPRDGVARHDFRGANFFMVRLLNRNRGELGVVSRPPEMEAAAERIARFLREEASTVTVSNARLRAGRVEADVLVRNLAGHKLPTAYPSRRAWLSVSVTDADGRVLFSSGRFERTGAIAGNDNDADAARYEPHYAEIRTQDQVQIYEAIMGTREGTVTTGLLSAATYLKDNRLLPRGFDKATANPDVAVQGSARTDPDFHGGEDTVRYSVDVSGGRGPYVLAVQLWYQPTSYRWTQNLKAYDAPEPQRMVRYWDEMAAASAIPIAQATARISD